eukprot:m.548868 g.548868  ORF g.548868 m.548868 type:complete len:90 (+) comp22158_c1_seq87:208-477(+)
MNAAVLLAVAVWTALATLTSTQDTTACGPYDISKGTATCNGKVVNVYSLLCPNWNAKTCQVSQITPDGQVRISMGCDRGFVAVSLVSEI